MTPTQPFIAAPPFPKYVPVVLDGRLMGHVPTIRSAGLVQEIRALKVARLALQEGGGAAGVGAGDHLSTCQAALPEHMEVAHLPVVQVGAGSRGQILAMPCIRWHRPHDEVLLCLR